MVRFPEARAEGATKNRKAERPERKQMMHEYYEKARKDAREDFDEFFNQTLPSVSPSAIQ